MRLSVDRSSWGLPGPVRCGRRGGVWHGTVKWGLAWQARQVLHGVSGLGSGGMAWQAWFGPYGFGREGYGSERLS